MKPVIVQTMIQAAKKRRRMPDSELSAELKQRLANPPRKDRSSAILIGAVILFFVLVALTSSL